MEASGLLASARARQAEVDSVLERFFSLARRRAEPLGPAYVELWDALKAATDGGKRFRPLMVITAYDALGGSDREAAANVGAAFELLHTALIVHDDVIDRDFVRRGEPNVAGLYRDRAAARALPGTDPEHRGISAAVIAGDLALTAAFRLIDRSGATGETHVRLLELMDEAVFASAAGELLDIELTDADEAPRVDDIIVMERLKTAVYSFEGPLQAGAVLAGAADECVATLGDFGRDIGIAYQIVDDVLGVFGDEGVTGKSTIGDLREGKRTVLLSFAWDRVGELVGHPDLGEDDASRVRELLIDAGAKDFAESLARYYANRALTRLAEPCIPRRLRKDLHPLADAVLGRVR